jgi:hypothetical protein
MLILYVEQENNSKVPNVEDKVIRIKYSSTKYKNFYNKQMCVKKEIINNDIDNSSSSDNNEKIDLYEK